MSTPMHAVVDDDPGSRVVTLKIAVPVEVAEPPWPPWLSLNRIVFVANVLLLLLSVTVHTAHVPVINSATARPNAIAVRSNCLRRVVHCPPASVCCRPRPNIDRYILATSKCY